jgi:hypothetical protein
MLMCQSVPPPPMNVPPLPEDARGRPQTMRQKLAIHRAVEPCKTCHTLMDPIGSPTRTSTASAPSARWTPGQVIDASGDLDGMRLQEPARARDAAAQQPARHGLPGAQHLPLRDGPRRDGGEEPAVLQIAQGFKDGKFQYAALVNSVVKSAASCWRRPRARHDGRGGHGRSDGRAGTAGRRRPTRPAPGAARPGTGGVVTPPAMVGYAKDVAPIIANKCSPCHTTDAKAGFNWSYDNLVTNSA